VIKKLKIFISDASKRLDKALVDGLSEDAVALGASRARIQRLIKSGCVELKGKSIKDPNHKVKAGDVVTVVLPPPEPAEPQAQAMPLEIVYEDGDLLVINKAAGVVVHPAAGNRDGTLVNALLAHCGGSLSGIGGVARPGIVHRLDKDTSGLLVVAKNDATHHALSRQFADRTLSRVYQALVWGVLSPLEGQIEGAVGRHPKARQKMAVVARGGKAALTHYKVLESFGGIASLVACKLATGRTHQIRVHMAHFKHPVVGDGVYGRRRVAAGVNLGGREVVGVLQGFPRQALHAARLSFTHPRTGKKMSFKAPLPADMAGLLRSLRSK